MQPSLKGRIFISMEHSRTVKVIDVAIGGGLPGGMLITGFGAPRTSISRVEAVRLAFRWYEVTVLYYCKHYA